MQQNTVKIRVMKIEDYPDIYKLWISTPGMGLNNLDDSREGIEKFLRRNPDTCFVAEKEQNVIGTIICGHDGRRGYVYHTAVAEEQRGNGIGKALVMAALDALEKEEIHKAALVVFTRNEAGNEFWEKCGFTTREDLVYRNRTIQEMVRIDT